MDSRICYHCFAEISNLTGPCPHCGYDAAVDADSFPLALKHGAILHGRYIVGRVLGQGGFGITYVAQDVQTEKRVAIKEYFPESLVTRVRGHSVCAFSSLRMENYLYGKQRFLEEAQTLAQFIGIESIVRVRSYFEENNTAYFVMEYIDGVSLKTYLKQQGGRISWKEALDILFPIMDALSLVHSKGIIHRDIAPDNIFITGSGAVKLLDFGAARYSLGDRSSSLDVVLKAGYAPMEQYARHSRQGPYTDVYSMAATLCHCITGKTPPEAVDRAESSQDKLVLPSALSGKIPSEAEEALEDILEKALSVRSLDRFQTMSEFRDALAEMKRLAERLEQEPAPKRSLPVGLIPGCAAAAAVLMLVLLLGQKDTQQPQLNHQTAVPVQTTASQATEAPSLPAVTLTTEATTAPTADPVDVIIQQADAFAARGDYIQAITHIWDAQKDREDPRLTDAIVEYQRLFSLRRVAAGSKHSVALRQGGTVDIRCVCDPGTCYTGNWSDIVSVAAGDFYILGLTSDGRVKATGRQTHYEGVSDWRNVTVLTAGDDHCAALLADGTVVATGYNEDGQCNTAGLYSDSPIVSVCAGYGHTVALHADGTVTAVGRNNYGQCDVTFWTGIVAVGAGSEHTVGLRADGTLVATGSNNDNQCSIQGWSNVVFLGPGDYHTLAVRADGTVLSTGRSWEGQCDVDSWSGIWQAAGGNGHSIALRENGELVNAGNPEVSLR